MTTFEPWAAGDTRPDVGARSATCAALNADIRALGAAKDVVEIVSVKAVFESVISILALVRVRVSVSPIYYARSLGTQLGWTYRRRRVRRVSQVLRSSMPRIEDRERREKCG